MLPVLTLVGRGAYSIAKPIVIVTAQIAAATAINVVVVVGTFATIGLIGQAGAGIERQYAKTIRRLHARLPA